MPAAPGLESLQPGLTGRIDIVVGPEQTAPHVGSGAVPVLATPVMVNLMEAAALAAVERFLPPGQQTVGTVLNVRHFAATPVGIAVQAEAELVEVNGRTLVFRVSARDAKEPIGDGMHERIVIGLGRFDARMAEKAAQFAHKAGGAEASGASG